METWTLLQARCSDANNIVCRDNATNDVVYSNNVTNCVGDKISVIA